MVYYNMPYGRRTRLRRFKRAVRRKRYAGKYRRRRRARKSSVYASRKRKTTNIKIGRMNNQHLSLRTRVKRLEISSKKHYDFMESRPTGTPINAVGVSNGTLTNESFTNMLSIQPRNGDGTIPPASGSARGTERNTREGMEVFCTKVRLRGRVLGIRINDTNELASCLYGFTDSVSGTDHYNFPQDRATQIRSACQSRVHMWVLQDTRPSTIDPLTGVYQPNPLPSQPMNPLQGMFLEEGLTPINSLQTLGPDSALRNYTNNRFKIVHHSVLTFDYLHPAKWFDTTINVNKKLIFATPDPAVVPQPPLDPVNYNLLVYFSGVPAELNHSALPEFIMNNVSTSPPSAVNLLLAPNLQMISSRTYFRET